MKVLFLLKKGKSYGYSNHPDPSTGLFNSASILADQLRSKLGFNTTLKVVVDGNSIDRELSIIKPDVCIIEAIWVTPDKMDELTKLHPNVKFVVRVHSELPFLANEGSALSFIGGYNVDVAFNSIDTYRDLRCIYDNVAFLPNVYEDVSITIEELLKYIANRLQFAVDSKGWTKLSWKTLHIGCFGAIRPMKNQLIQAVAAINYANKAGVKLYFHMNSTRVEQKGEGVLKNIIALFDHTDHELVLHPWLNREEFLDLISNMDLGLQVSMNESFNIIAADFVKQGVPVVVSEAIKWAPNFSKASTIMALSIEEHIGQALRYHRMYRRGQKLHLKLYNEDSLQVWKDFFGSLD